jgi:hypothetical protein
MKDFVGFAWISSLWLYSIDVFGLQVKAKTDRTINFAQVNQVLGATPHIPSTASHPAVHVDTPATA